MRVEITSPDNYIGVILNELVGPFRFFEPLLNVLMMISAVCPTMSSVLPSLQSVWGQQQPWIDR